MVKIRQRGGGTNANVVKVDTREGDAAVAVEGKLYPQVADGKAGVEDECLLAPVGVGIVAVIIVVEPAIAAIIADVDGKIIEAGFGLQPLLPTDDDVSAGKGAHVNVG